MISSTDTRRSLAVFGAEPLSKDPLYIIKPPLPDRAQFDSSMDLLYKRRLLTNQGPFAVELERELERTLDVKHVVLVSSATIGLQLVARAMALKGEIIVPSFTFIATAHSMLWEGLTPVFADINAETLTIDVRKLEPLVTDRTSAILGVHLFGNPCHVAELSEFSKKHELALFYDAAQAFGSRIGATPVGRFGQAEVFSLHATKILHTLEGGFIATNSTSLQKKLVMMRNFGFSEYDRVDGLGINAKMNEMSAAVGLGLLPGVEARIAKNHELKNLYRNLLKDIPGIRWLPDQFGVRTNGHTLPILVDEDFGITRDQLCHVFWAENVITRRYYYPGCHRQSPYKDTPLRQPLPTTEKVAASILCLPIFSSIDEGLVRSIAHVVRQCYIQRDELRAYFQTNALHPHIT